MYKNISERDYHNPISPAFATSHFWYLSPAIYQTSPSPSQIPIAPERHPSRQYPLCGELLLHLLPFAVTLDEMADVANGKWVGEINGRKHLCEEDPPRSMSATTRLTSMMNVMGSTHHPAMQAIKPNAPAATCRLADAVGWPSARCQ